MRTMRTKGGIAKDLVRFLRLVRSSPHSTRSASGLFLIAGCEL